MLDDCIHIPAIQSLCILNRDKCFSVLLQPENRDVSSKTIRVRAEVRPVVQRRLRAAEPGDERAAEAVPRRQGQAAGQEERAQARPAGHQRRAQQRACGK